MSNPAIIHTGSCLQATQHLPDVGAESYSDANPVASDDWSICEIHQNSRVPAGNEESGLEAGEWARLVMVLQNLIGRLSDQTLSRDWSASYHFVGRSWTPSRNGHDVFLNVGHIQEL